MNILCYLNIGGLINGAKVVAIIQNLLSLAILKKTNDVGLQGFENINYLQAIKRVIGRISQLLIN